MGKKKCLVLELSLGLHDDQSVEIQVEGLPSRGADQRCIQKLENLILQFFKDEIIDDMQQEEGWILKLVIFNEAWLFGYIPFSKEMEYLRNQKFRIQGAELHLSL